MKIRPIKTKADYEKALARVDALMDAKPDSPKVLPLTQFMCQTLGIA